MKNLSIKSAIILVSIWTIWLLVWIVPNFSLMNNLPKQYSLVAIPGTLIWITSAIIMTIIVILLVKPIEDRFKKIKELSDKELKHISKKALNINLTLCILFAATFLISSVILIFILSFSFGTLATRSIWVPGIPGTMAVPFMLYGAISLFFSKVNRKFSAELNMRNITTRGIRINIQQKFIFIFGSSVIAMALWIGLYGYYTGINQKIQEIKVSGYSKLAIIKQSLEQNKSTENYTSEYIIKKINNLKLPNNELILLLNPSGNILSDKNKLKKYESKRKNIYALTKENIHKKYIYDNVNQNIICYHVLNKNYSLMLISHLTTESMSKFWIWFAIFLLIGFFVVGFNIITFSSWIDKSVANLVKLFEKLAEKNFSENATTDSEDEFGLISRKYNRSIVQIRELIKTIQDNSKSVLNAGIQLSSISQQISQNASEQASTTEEISSSMEEMLAMISSNTQNASITGKSAENSANELKQSNEFFIQMLNSVSEIIKKISIITEIAGKTDILSINAAIEAARAGETGKGFAVVAYEIRKLADKTKMAAVEIGELSEKGQNISKIAGDKLAKTIPDIIKSTELVNQIVAAGKEQQSGVENINNSIQQLTEITNQNSASAEEMSVSAEQLTAQAEQLKELISVFKIDDIQEATTEEKEEEKEEKLTKTTNQKGKIVPLQITEKINIDLSNNDDKDEEFEKY